MTPEELMEHLKEVPESRPRIVELAWELVGADGTVDPQQVAFRIDEVNTAREEVIRHNRDTARIVEALKKCGQ